MTNAPLWPVVDADKLLIGVVELFAARPELPDKIIRKLASDKLAGHDASVFKYLFEVTTRPAFGAEDYFVPGYRVLSPKEADAAFGALNVEHHVVEGGHESEPRP